jgi:hypothetical protein
MPVPSKLGIISNALVRLGEKPLQSLDSDEAEAVMASAIYDEVTMTALASNPWSFAIANVSPPQLAAASYTNDFTSRYQYAYELPVDDVIRVLGLESRDEYLISEDRELWTNDNDVEIWYIKEVPVQEYAPWFVSGLVMELAAAFSLSITGDNARTELFDRMARREMAKARNIDSQHVPPKFLDYMELILREGQVLF